MKHLCLRSSADVGLFRITEPLRLEKSSEVIERKLWLSFHHVNQSRALCAKSSHSLTKDGDSITSPGNPNQCLTTFSIRKVIDVQPGPGVATPNPASYFYLVTVSFLMRFSLSFQKVSW